MGYEGDNIWPRWLVEDQREAAGRTDVATFISETLTAPLKIAGEPIANLVASTTGTDSDWVVKLIDVYPDEVGGDAVMGGYQLMIAADIFRGRYRESFAKAKPIAADTPLLYRFALPTANHVFLPGHRIMVQIQSSWFPLYDRNPQTFVPNIFWAKPGDYRKATQRIYHSPEQSSFIDLPVAARVTAQASAGQKNKDPLVELNSRFRTAYAEARKELLAKQPPVIIADGDSVILLRHGQRTEVKVTAMADIVKPISHTPLAIHTLLASAGEAELTQERLRALQTIRDLIEPAAKSLAGRGLPQDIHLLHSADNCRVGHVSRRRAGQQESQGRGTAGLHTQAWAAAADQRRLRGRDAAGCVTPAESWLPESWT